MAAITGSAPTFPVPTTSVPEFLFSNPFHKDAKWVKQGDPVNQGHYLEDVIPEHKAAFVTSTTGGSISHGRLRKDVHQVAAGLRYKLGLKQAPFFEGSRGEPIVSDVVLLHLPNCIAQPVLKLATWTAGLTCTAVNSALKPAEVAYIINGCKPAAIFTLAGEGGLDVILDAMEFVEDKSLVDRHRDGRIFTVDPVIDDYGLASQQPAKNVNSRGAQVRDWKWLLDTSSKEQIYPAYDARKKESDRRAALILWSSGTSGKSKGVLLSHTALNASVQALWYGNLDFNAHEVFIGFVPFFHVFGLCNVELLTVACGATTVCMHKFDPVSFLTLAQQYRATHLHMAPPIAVILAKSPMLDNFDISAVRGGTSGGAPLGPAIVEAVYHRLGFFIRLGYGLSETASVTSTVAKNWEELQPYLEFTGRACPGVELKVISTSGDGKTLKRGDTGEFLIRSPSIMNCYLNNAQATAESLDAEGWFHTGDVGYIHESGNVRITDRLKEVIKVKGFQVAPAELEAYLCGHDQVADAGVTRTYSEEEATEYPLAYIVPNDKKLLQESSAAGKASPATVEFVTKVLKYMEEKTVHYKWIRGGVIVADAIPKSNSGKILRKDFNQVKGYHVQLYQPKKRPTRQSKL